MQQGIVWKLSEPNTWRWLILAETCSEKEGNITKVALWRTVCNINFPSSPSDWEGQGIVKESYIQDLHGHSLQGARSNVFSYSLLTLLAFTSWRIKNDPTNPSSPSDRDGRGIVRRILYPRSSWPRFTRRKIKFTASWLYPADCRIRSNNLK
jgi:hypothetical protein